VTIPSKTHTITHSLAAGTIYEIQIYVLLSGLGSAWLWRKTNH